MKYETLTKEQIDSLVETGVMPESVEEVKPENNHDELIKEAKLRKIKGYTKMSDEEIKEALSKGEEK